MGACGWGAVTRVPPCATWCSCRRKMMVLISQCGTADDHQIEDRPLPLPLCPRPSGMTHSY